MKRVSCMNRHLSGPCYIRNASLIFRMLSIRCHVKRRLSPGCQFLSFLSHDPISSKETSRNKTIINYYHRALVQNKLSLGTTATLVKILIFSKTQRSLYMLCCKSIYPGMRSLFIKPCSKLKLILIYVKQNHHKKASCKMPLINPLVLKNLS